MALQKSTKGWKRPQPVSKPHMRPKKGKPLNGKSYVKGGQAAPRAAVKAPKGGRR